MPADSILERLRAFRLASSSAPDLAAELSSLEARVVALQRRLVTGDTMF